MASAEESGGIGVQATMLLCDSAQSVGGKLYILGGGWSQVHAAGLAGGATMALAVHISVPWDQANEALALTARLTTEDGTPAEANGSPIQAEGRLEVGRPPGLKRGTPLDSTMALNFAGLALDPGGYVWELLVDGKPKARTPFRVSG